MALTTTQIQQLYTAYLGRPADQAGVNYWKEQGVSEFELRANLANDNQPEYVELYGDRTREELVTAIYQNMFGREPEAEGLEYWVNGEGASVPASELQQLFISAASAEDRAAFDARVAADEANITPLPPEQGTSETIMLTQRADNLEGTDGVDTTFRAPVTQNETGSGALANTFETGDVLNGGANSTNELRADLIATGTIQDAINGVAISAETTNIQNVFIRAQAGQNDGGAANTTYAATIDAEKMVGVEQWWTENSRADVRIEDIRTRPVDTTFGMRSTDPEVSFDAYFNPLFMDGDVDSESALTIEVAEIDGSQVIVENELANITVNSLRFTLAGEEYVLTSEAMQAADTWAELEAAIAAELEAAGLETLVVSHLGEGRFGIVDEQGREFSSQGGLNIDFGNTDVRNTFNTGLEVAEGPTETTLVLDGAGNGSRGGDVNIAAMSGDRGVEVFNVVVDRSSHLKSMRSENNPRSTDDSFSAEQQLEEVYLTHLEGGAQGAFQLGARTVDQNGVSTTIDDRLSVDVDEDGEGDSGLRDVRVFDATGYAAQIKLAAELSINVFDKYLAGAEEPVQFSYLLGNAGNNLSLTVDNEVASDPDFALEIIGGDGDDRVNLTDLAVKNTTSIDLDEGTNTVEINTTTGAGSDEDGNYEASAAAAEYTAEQTAFAGFENVDRLVIAGELNTRQHIVNGNLTAIDGQEIVIATEGGVNTDIVAARIDTELTISGKNQTLGSLNNNNDQEIGVVNILNTRPVETQNNLEVTLDNTARLNGELTVAELNVGTEGAGATSAVSVLDLTSAGRRDTSNLVQSATLAGVNTVNLDGSQDLGIHIASMAVNAQGASTPSVVDASALTGDLDLAMNAAILNGATDVLTGTNGTNDTLAVYGAGATATVTGFETVQLGLAITNQFTGAVQSFQGTFNAAAVSGVNQYDLVNLDGATVVDNLGNDQTIIVREGADQNITLNAASESAQITVDFRADYNADLTVVDYRTVTLDLAGSETGIAYDFDLTLNNGSDPTYARTLEITGGESTNDSITLGTLDTALTTIDYSDYTGSFVSGENLVSVDAAVNYAGANGYGWNDTAGSNAKIFVNSNAFQFSVAGDDGNGNAAVTEFITEFVFTSDASSVGTVWQIDDFQVFGATNSSTQGAAGTLQDRTLLNLRELDLSETDVSQRDLSDWWNNVADQAEYDADFAAFAADSAAGAHTVIVGNGEENFTILLTGVAVGDLNDENFLYA
ncbi:DUF4214 domain-containing protein [Vreelandella stevensii]|uniref:DUF4214 domain-containing protein n=1 Tax=Vreelandella stevensii TaxID=502821 RepID=UPI0037480027